MFEHLPRYAGDPILGLMSEFAEDSRVNKVNLGVGIYYDEEGKIPLLQCVSVAEQAIVDQHSPRSYLPMEGELRYRNIVAELLLGNSLEKSGQKASVIQTVGGSGALKVGADFLRLAYPKSTVYVSNPTWDNHLGIFEGAGFEVRRYAYYQSEERRFDYQGAIADFLALPQQSIVLLHPCCHNPTGIQPTQEQWLSLLDLLEAKNAIPFLDIAYQGFGLNLRDDAWLIRECARRGMDFLVSSSFSKTFSLYGERVGALSVVSASSSADLIMGQLKQCVRRNYSSPPMFGATLVASVLTDPHLRKLWESELGEMRERIVSMRNQLADGLARLMPERDFTYLKRQEGMFAYTGLSAEQVRALKVDHGVYAIETGRICVAGLSASNIERVCQAFAAVMA